MNAAATTTIRILSGTVTDAYGDEVDSLDAGSYRERNIKASLIEQSRQQRNPADGEIRSVQAVMGRVGGHVNIQVNDRVLDEQTGKIYLVEQVHQTRSPVNIGDKILKLEYTSGG